MIFYFSGTGCSRRVAKEIARVEEDTVINAADVISGKVSHAPEGRNDAIGFVLPTYFYGLPSITEALIDEIGLSEVHGRYIYLVMTCGSSTGNACGQFARLLRERGLELSACFAVKTVDSYILLFDTPKEEEQKRLLAEMDAQARETAERIHNRETGDMNGLKGIFPRFTSAMSYPLYERGRKTKPFAAGDRCIGCGKCAEECPVGAILIEDGKPRWVKEQCTLCLRCIHGCPERAIEYGRATKRRGRFTCPEKP